MNYLFCQQLDINVLVVDDDEAILKGMQHLLSNWGCRCITADSIETALAKASITAPDLLICDYRLRDLHTGGEAIYCAEKLIREYNTRDINHRRYGTRAFM